MGKLFTLFLSELFTFLDSRKIPKAKKRRRIVLLTTVWLLVASILIYGAIYPRKADFRSTKAEFDSIQHVRDSHSADHFRLKTQDGVVYWMQHPHGMYDEEVMAAFSQGDPLEITYYPIPRFSCTRYAAVLKSGGVEYVSMEETVAYYRPFQIISRILIVAWLALAVVILAQLLRYKRMKNKR